MLTFISGKLFLTRGFWFWWGIGVAVWYLRMPLHWHSSSEHTLEVTLPAMLRVLWFAARAAVKWELNTFCLELLRGCTAGGDLGLWSMAPGWNNSSEATRNRWFVDIWFSPQALVSTALVSMVRLDFLRFHFHESSALQVCSVVVSSSEHADCREGPTERTAGANPMAVSVNWVLEVSHFSSA